MNNIIHSFDLNSSSLSSSSSNATTTTTTTNNYQALLSHFCSWQRSRKMMAKMFSTSSTSTTAKNSSSSTSFVGHQINPINNLCYQSVSINNNNNNDHNQQKFPHQTFVNRKYMIGRNNNKSNPIVSFLNKGDGKIAVNFKTKSPSSPLPSSLEKPLVILQNDNQLYSMDILMASSSSDHHRTSESNCYATLEPPTVDYNNYQQQQQNDYNYIDPNDPFSNESWYYGTIEREHAIHLIENCPTGKKTNYYNGSIIPATTKSSSSSSLAMYGSSTYRSNWNLVQSPTTTIDDRMVDVDLDPTYQRILENFRKAMAHCN
ncbi:hypothetical protein DERP_006468 [Dermatophagoides pteronyssinus]|uniref:Uncharacterized protein n=1 Tax=Dermatophagoides pteronyssinus TaxID=6956 RepID=A0ABQ8IQ86_DERPT|nr:hypothetical protein DERP_006468 [Dermatophagoides pteronyssinus]